MKGRFDAPFDTLYIALERNTPLYAELARQLKAGSYVTLTDSAQGADAVFTLVNKTQSRDILSTRRAPRWPTIWRRRLSTPRNCVR